MQLDRVNLSGGPVLVARQHLNNTFFVQHYLLVIHGDATNKVAETHFQMNNDLECDLVHFGCFPKA